MIDLSGIPKTSSLIDNPMKEQLRGILAAMKAPVVLKAVVDMKREKDIEMASFLQVVSEQGDLLSLELYAPAEAAARVPELDITYLPATGLYRDGEYGRVAFHGVPGGKEFNSFVAALLCLSGSGPDVPDKLAQTIRKLTKPANIKICVSLSCHHCPAVVAACQQIAVLSPVIAAEMIDAALYPELVDRFNISRVPMVIIDNCHVHMGSKSMDEMVDLLKN